VSDDGRLWTLLGFVGLTGAAFVRGSRGVVRAGRSSPKQPDRFRVKVEHRTSGDEIEVWAGGVDRRQVAAWLIPPHLTDRFVRAIEAGTVLTWNGILTDVQGKTYWSTTSNVLTRKLESELERLGF
jgi:hypothetical protein